MIRRLAALFISLTLATTQALASGCGQPATSVSQIQGNGDQSPLQGRTVTVEGIVTRDARHGTGLQGFYLQQADSETDSDPATSEALFIYTRKSRGREGQRVRVTGQVKEFHGLTELHRVSDLRTCGTGVMPEPVPVTLPWSASNQPESYENMRVFITRPMTIVDQYFLLRYGQVTLATTDQWIPTQQHEPGPEARAMAADQEKARLLLDDGQGITHPDTLAWLDGSALPRAGDRIGPVTGIFDYRFGDWRLHPDQAVSFHDRNPRPDRPARPVASNLRVMTINLENYFNGNGQGDGFGNSRGAKNTGQLQRQTAKLVAALTAPDPDVIAVMELENDGFDPNSSIAGLSAALGKSWQFVEATELPAGGAIRSGLLYRSDRVTLSGPPAVLELPASQGRAVLAQAFGSQTGSRNVRIIVSHLKSKSCHGAKGANRDQNDGQGCWSAARTQAAERIARWVRQLPRLNSPAGNLITGDLNSYAREAPIMAFERAGFSNLAPTSTYSYRYRGRRGTLDYALADSALQPAVIRTAYWPINADEAPALAFDGPPNTRETGLWRASDHDPIITDLQL